MGGTAHLEMELPRHEAANESGQLLPSSKYGIYEGDQRKLSGDHKAVCKEKDYEKSKNEKDFLLKSQESLKKGMQGTICD